MLEKFGLELLKQSADKLQDYRAEVDGDYNDSLAMEIYKYLDSKNEASEAFDKAILQGRLSSNPEAENFAGRYMYMGIGNKADGTVGDAFKNINTRQYDV